MKMKASILLLIIVACLCCFVIDAKQSNEVANIENRMLSEFQKLNDTTDAVVDQGPSDQERLDTVVKALSNLPTSELERLGVDLSIEIREGTNEAVNLMRAWSDRQLELKTAMKSVLQPAEFMTKLSYQLSSSESSNSEIEQALVDLESLLADIDNARDFHTIGSWPVLVGMLSESRPVAQRTLAAWAIGTAVKNSYDYQLWILENVAVGEVQVNALKLLVETLDFSSQPQQGEAAAELIELQKRSLYALSSALRGNVDVQYAVLDLAPHEKVTAPHSESWLVHQLFSIATDPATAPDVSRKVWSFVSDMLQEVRYIREELDQEIAQMIAAASRLDLNSTDHTVINLKGEAAAEETTTQPAATAVTPLQQAIDSVRNMKLLGDSFISAPWLQEASSVLSSHTRQLLSLATSGQHSAITVDATTGEETMETVVSSADRSRLQSSHAIVSSVLVALHDMVTLASPDDSSFSASCKATSAQIAASLKDLDILQGEEAFEDLAGPVQELLLVLDRCGVMSNHSGLI